MLDTYVADCDGWRDLVRSNVLRVGDIVLFDDPNGGAVKKGIMAFQKRLILTQYPGLLDDQAEWCARWSHAAMVSDDVSIIEMKSPGVDYRAIFRLPAPARYLFIRPVIATVDHGVEAAERFARIEGRLKYPALELGSYLVDAIGGPSWLADALASKKTNTCAATAVQMWVETGGLVLPAGADDPQDWFPAKIAADSVYSIKGKAVFRPVCLIDLFRSSDEENQ